MLVKRLNKYWQLTRDRVRRELGVLLFDRKLEKVICPIGNLQHIVFIRWDAKWGDAIISSLMLEPLRKTYPDIKITIVTSGTLTDYFENYLDVDQVIEISFRPTYRRLKQLANQLGSVDLLIHFNRHMKMKDLYLLYKVQAKTVAGLDDGVGRVNLKLGQATQGLHFSQKLVYLLQCFDIKVESSKYQVPINTKQVEQAEQFLASKARHPLLVFNAYGGDRSRRLNQDNSRKIINAVLEILPDINVVVLVTPDTESEVKKLCSDLAKDNVFYYPESSTIYDAIALVFKSSWVISVDTAIVHIAAGLNKPLLALYNADELNYVDWHPNSGKAITCFSEAVRLPDINAIDWQSLQSSISVLLKS